MQRNEAVALLYFSKYSLECLSKEIFHSGALQESYKQLIHLTCCSSSNNLGLEK